MKNKDIFQLKLHETTVIEEEIKMEVKDPNGNLKETTFTKTFEVTKVPGGWVYIFEYPFSRQNPAVFVPTPNK